jgi:hypothetical protein
MEAAAPVQPVSRPARIEIPRCSLDVSLFMAISAEGSTRHAPAFMCGTKSPWRHAPEFKALAVPHAIRTLPI